MACTTPTKSRCSSVVAMGDWAHAQTRGIAADFHDWTDDPNAIERVREQLAARLDSDCGIKHSPKRL